jgi:hypothetical protein
MPRYTSAVFASALAVGAFGSTAAAQYGPPPPIVIYPFYAPPVVGYSAPPAVYGYAMPPPVYGYAPPRVVYGYSAPVVVLPRLPSDVRSYQSSWRNSRF